MNYHEAQEWARQISGPTAEERDEMTRNAIETEKQRKADDLRRINERTANMPPAPEPYLPDGSVNPIWRAAHPLQQVVNLPDPGAGSWSQGTLPAEVVVAEADRLKTPEAMLRRIKGLEDYSNKLCEAINRLEAELASSKQRIAALEAKLDRFFGEPTGGPSRI